MKSLKERERSVGEMDSVKLRCTREMGGVARYSTVSAKGLSK